MRDVAAVSWGDGRIDLFWRDDADALWHRSFERGAWAAAEDLGGTLASGPAVTAWAVNQMEVFAVFPDGTLWNRYWDGAAWHPWESLGGELAIGPTPAASSWEGGRLDVFATGIDGDTWHRWWDGTRWVEWEQLAGLGPEVIVAMPCGYHLDGSRAQALAYGERLEALGAGRVFAVDAASTFSRPGPRLVDGVELLGHLLHPHRVEAPAGIGFAELSLQSSSS